MTRSIHLKSDQAARLLAALRSADADGGHLSDEDFVSRAFDDVSAEDKARIDAHVASCDPCREELERTRAIATDMNTEERRPQIDRLWNGFLGAAGQQHRLMDLMAALRQIVLPVPRLATRGGPLPTRGALAKSPADGRVVAEGSAVDGLLRWRFTEKESGDLNGLIACSDVEQLRGATVSLNTDPPRSLALVETGGELRAEFMITKDEWRRMPRGPVIDKIVFSDGDVITSDGTKGPPEN